MQGYCGKILRVNLSDKEVKIEPLNNKMMDTFIGGKGFGAKMLYEEVKRGIDPLDPDNKLLARRGGDQMGSGDVRFSPKQGRTNLGGLMLFSASGLSLPYRRFGFVGGHSWETECLW